MTHLAALAGPLRCEVCGVHRSTRMTVHAQTVLACPEHPWCADCAFPHVATVCPRDSERVRHRTSAEAAAAELRKELAVLDIVLPAVPIELVPWFPGHQLGEALAKVEGGRRRPEVVRILNGLGSTRFRLVAVHELSHCMIQMRRVGELDRQVEEGTCELVAVVWLCSTDRPDADRHLRQTWRNAHPLYGESMRAAVRSARRHGVPAVLDCVLREGRLP